SDAGYDLVLLGQTSVGELEITASLQQTPNQEQVLGLHLTLPRIGKLTLGMAIDPDGTARVASVARHLPDGTPAGASLPSEQTLRTKLTALKVELQRERWKSASREEQLAQLKARVESIDTFKGRLEALEQEHQVQLRKLQKQTKQKQTDADELSLAHAALVRERDQLKVQLDGAHHEIASLTSDRGELEDLVREETEAAAERERGLIVERNEALQERALLEERERTTLAERDEAVAACAAWAERDQELSGERDERENALRSELQQEQANLEQARGELETTVSALASSRDEQLALQARISELETLLKTRAGDAETQLALREARVEELQALLAQREAALETARNTAGDATALRREVLEAQARIDALVNEKQGTGSDAQLQEAQGKLTAALAKLTSSESENAELRRKLTEQTEVADHTRQKLTAESEVADQLRAENFDVRALADNAAAEGQRKSEELAALEGKLAALETELTTARSQLSELNETAGKVQDELSTQQVSVADLTTRLNSESGRASAFYTSSESLRARVEQLPTEQPPLPLTPLPAALKTPAPPPIPAMSAWEMPRTPRPPTPRPIPVLTPQPVQATVSPAPVESNEPTAPFAMPDPQLLASDEQPEPLALGSAWLEEPTASHRLPHPPPPSRKRR
ncbi:MAG: hypothetical protein ACT4TC_06085, partial [Myxococcaceae bacterium]